MGVTELPPSCPLGARRKGTLLPAVVLGTGSATTRRLGLVPPLPLHAWAGRGTCADAVRLIPQRAEVAVHAVGAQGPAVARVALAGPVALPAAVSATAPVPAAGPLGPALARCGDRAIRCTQEAARPVLTEPAPCRSLGAAFCQNPIPALPLEPARRLRNAERASGQPRLRLRPRMLTPGGVELMDSKTVRRWPHATRKRERQAGGGSGQ